MDSPRPRRGWGGIDRRDLQRSKATKPIEYPVRGFLVYVMAGQQRFAADILGALPPDGERIANRLPTLLVCPHSTRIGIVSLWPRSAASSIESVLSLHPAVAEVAVAGLPDEPLGPAHHRLRQARPEC
jgi:hypothetical protein